jgi:hypothetical protein
MKLIFYIQNIFSLNVCVWRSVVMHRKERDEGSHTPGLCSDLMYVYLHIYYIFLKLFEAEVAVNYLSSSEQV